MPADPKPVAAIVTEYRENTHADMILGRILEGYDFQGRDKPDLKLVSLYTHQVPENDWSRALAKKHDVLICETIDSAVTRGSSGLTVDGVLIIGENGDYPLNNKGQKLYPRRQFFEQVTTAFEKHGRSVPVFSAKHLACTWSDAKWMYDQSRRQLFPLMAGSALPLTWRRPALELPRGCRIAEALAVGYGDIESSGFHALEMLQCMVERRRGGERGVASVRYVEGRDVWRVADPPSRLLGAALECCPNVKSGSPRDNCDNKEAAFVINFCDGLRAYVLMLNGHVEHFSFAARLRGTLPSVRSCQFYLQPARPFGHFRFLVRAIENFVRAHQAPYPVERTLLTTGMLDFLMTSRKTRQLIETPELLIEYDPVDYPFAHG
jgi:hypothetical protein